MTRLQGADAPALAAYAEHLRARPDARPEFRRPRPDGQDEPQGVAVHFVVMQDAAGHPAAELRRHGRDFVRLEHLTSVSGGSSRGERRLGAEDVEQPASPVSGVEPRAVELRVQRRAADGHGLQRVGRALDLRRRRGGDEAREPRDERRAAGARRTGCPGAASSAGRPGAAAGVARGRTWLAPTIPALPAEQPQPSSAPRSSTTTEAPCSATRTRSSLRRLRRR